MSIDLGKVVQDAKKEFEKGYQTVVNNNAGQEMQQESPQTEQPAVSQDQSQGQEISTTTETSQQEQSAQTQPQASSTTKQGFTICGMSPIRFLLSLFAIYVFFVAATDLIDLERPIKLLLIFVLAVGVIDILRKK